MNWDSRQRFRCLVPQAKIPCLARNETVHACGWRGTALQTPEITQILRRIGSQRSPGTHAGVQGTRGGISVCIDEVVAPTVEFHPTGAAATRCSDFYCLLGEPAELLLD